MTNSSDTWVARIYMSGPMDVAKQALRAECWRDGLCVTIEPTMFIYTGGEESGFVVGFVNYPRFPKTPDALEMRARHVCDVLLAATHQRSALLIMPSATEWITAEPDTTTDANPEARPPGPAIAQLQQKWRTYQAHSPRYFNTPTDEDVVFNERCRLRENALIDVFLEDLASLYPPQRRAYHGDVA